MQILSNEIKIYDKYLYNFTSKTVHITWHKMVRPLAKYM